MPNSEPESGLNFNFIMPAALLLVLLIVPFSINSFMHLMSAKRQFNPVIMKLPMDSTAITIPSAVKQYESFEVALNLETKQLSRFLNEIVATASEGTSIQGITGVVSPYMKAEIAGEDFEIDRQGPQEPVSAYNGMGSWRWRVIPESSGSHDLKFQLHLLTQDAGQQTEKILDLAEARFSVQANPSEWFKRNGLWIALSLLVPVVIILGLRRRYAR
ncbi:hypothetical protein [Nitrosomonas sp. Nm166]|uniref:hypothetical protein n=1 Tax=Nitrosomonas sp. Nm166 TaxID=1881054 RepID=UPI0008E212E7|nr:hypothetical protein [Nitrosomonas sp. Nm166]SFE57691.1 hypothetical protein SAMN05428977_10219 [Nitrosomonas sp. Nm166]